MPPAAPEPGAPEPGAPEPGTEEAAAFVEPAYHSRSLGDILPAVAHALGIPDGYVGRPPAALVLPDAPAYVVLLVDGLGSELLRRYARAAPFLSELLTGAAVATAGVPSTTATSLTSLGTGLTPGMHGLVGYTSRVPGSTDLLNALAWDQPVDPLQWQPHETAFAQLAACGVVTTTITKSAFESSGLTVAAYRGAAFAGADAAEERLAATLAAATAAPSLTYLYDGDLDLVGHVHGVASTEWLGQLSAIDAQAERLREELPSSVRLVVVADHGMVDCPESSRIDVDAHGELLAGLELLGGEARFRHLYCRRGAVQDVAATWRGLLAGRAEVLTREQAIGRGWFGSMDPRVLPRLGDVLVACRGDFGVFSSARFAFEQTLVGVHGSLTADEMRIPILVS